VSLHQGSVSEPADCARVVQEVIDTYGGVDFLINNAGVTADKSVRKMGVDDWQSVLSTNLSGAFFMTSAVLDHMLERGQGRIVNISSVIGQTGNAGQANYAASKAGLIGFTKSLALETAQKGITVNCIAPGFIETDMVAAMPEKAREGLVERIPMRRLGRTSEVARIASFLCEDESSYITGSVFSVNGGLEM
jgi:NAD(P)-dependent dehydrogenase (short-subunit alcohol dehydrogenase family)